MPLWPALHWNRQSPTWKRALAVFRQEQATWKSSLPTMTLSRAGLQNGPGQGPGMKWSWLTMAPRRGNSLQQAEAPRLGDPRLAHADLDGVDVCRKVRQWDHAPYVYLILLTSKDRQEDIIAGLEAGADDYLTKPFDPQELEARLRAGERILDLQAALLTSLEQLAQAHQREVEIGARIQQTLLLGQPPVDMPGAQIAALTIPSQPVDGDFYDFFQYNAQCLDIIVGDVMGKGVPAALLGAAIKSALCVPSVACWLHLPRTLCLSLKRLPKRVHRDITSSSSV